MFHRCLTTLLLVAYVAAGFARAPHAHASQPPDHGSRPHVHFNWINWLGDSFSGSEGDHEAHHAHGAHDVHHHHGHSHHAHKHRHSHEAQRNVQNDRPDRTRDSQHDHDSTCVYVADYLEMTVPTCTFDDCVRVIAQIEILDDFAENLAASKLIRPEWSHAPPGALISGSDLILKLRTLRN